MTSKLKNLYLLLLLLLTVLYLPTYAHPEAESEEIIEPESAETTPEDYEHKCNHDQIEQNPEVFDIEEDMSAAEGQRFLASSSSSSSRPNLRIYPYFNFLRSTASSSYANYIEKEVVAPIITYFQSALRIKYPVSGNLRLGSSVNKICERTTPSILKTTGVSADLFFYFDSQAISSTQIANAKYCYLASGTRRPIIARAMINRNMMRMTSDVLTHEKNMYVLMHELMHSFGFSAYLSQFYVDNNGNTRKGHIKTLRIGGNTHTVVDVPPLTQKLRDFYGCQSLQGAVMEDDGGSGTATSHFERRFFPYEFMSSGSVNGRRVSEFSLAMLEGSGWYVPDYSYAEPFFYGKGQGCSFISGTCSSSRASFKEFCTGSSRGCAPHGRGGASCRSESLSDGCRWFYPSNSNDCENAGGSSNARLPALEVYGRGAGSSCFTGDLSTRKSASVTSFCFKYTCSGSGSSARVIVQLGKTQITCTRAEKRSVSGYYGTIDCPDPRTFCATVGKKYCPRNCMGRGSCVNGVCRCKSGYKGVDCALRA